MENMYFGTNRYDAQYGMEDLQIVENNDTSFTDTGFLMDYNVTPFTPPSVSSNNDMHADATGEPKLAYSIKFPEVEKCIPQWKSIFPWVCWSRKESVLFCIHCRELIRKSHPDLIRKSNVLTITSTEKIFTVAKILRCHHNSPYHASSIYLHSYSSLTSFISLFNNHYKDMKHENEVIDAARSIFNYSKLDKESFVTTVKSVGHFIEENLVQSLKRSKYFSVVADQCRGILILRWITEEGQTEEHVFWSYLLEWNISPMRYLKKFDINFDNLTLYIANSLCQQCPRCQNLSVKPASLPPRPPSTVSFSDIMWNLDFLRPVYLLVHTIYKIFKKYPYKFVKKFDASDLRSLFQVSLKPVIFLKIMDNFAVIKKIATEIYESGSFIEALGLALVDVKNDEQHKKILVILQEIIDTVKEATIIKTKITQQQIVKLNQALGSLKTWSSGANFVTYGNQESVLDQTGKSEKVREFLYFVEKFIDENQKSIYYNGREKVHQFISLCNPNNFIDESNELLDEHKLMNCFSVVFDVYEQVLKIQNNKDKATVFNSVKHFFNYLRQHQLTTTVNSCPDIIQLFYKDKQLQNLFPEAFEIFVFCATMPFQRCQLPRSLFVSFVVEQRIESSVWARMESDLKPWLLYLQHEHSHIQPKALLEWWMSTLPS